MSRIDVIVMDHRIGKKPPRFRQQMPDRLALKQIEVQCRRQNEDLGGACGDRFADGQQQRSFALMRLGNRAYCGKSNGWFEAQDRCAGRGHSASMGLRFPPCWFVGLQLRGEKKCGRGGNRP